MTKDDVQKVIDDYITRAMFELIEMDDETDRRCEAHNIHHVIINRGHYMHYHDDVYACKECGSPATANYAEPTKSQMLEHQLCLSCNYWQHLPPPSLVINYRVYADQGGTRIANRLNGHSGREFKIEMLDGSRQWTTNNLWSEGRIPKRWQHLFQNNAIFIRA